MFKELYPIAERVVLFKYVKLCLKNYILLPKVITCTTNKCRYDYQTGVIMIAYSIK